MLFSASIKQSKASYSEATVLIQNWQYAACVFDADFTFKHEKELIIYNLQLSMTCHYT